MCMFSITGKPNQRLRLEIDLKTVKTEDLTHKRTDKKLIIRCLHGMVVLPVDFNLLTDMCHAAAFVNLCLKPPHFLMPHLHVKPISIELDHAVLKSRTYCSMRAFPVLLIHHLRG